MTSFSGGLTSGGDAVFGPGRTYPARVSARSAGERHRARSVVQLLLSIAAPLLLLASMPTMSDLVAELHTTMNPSTVLGDLTLMAARGALMAVAAWSVIVMVAGVCARLPGAAGAWGRHIVHGIAPAAVRRVVFAAVGVTIVAGASACASTPSPAALPSATTTSSSTGPASPVAASDAGTIWMPGGYTDPASGETATYIPSLEWPTTSVPDAADPPASSHDSWTSADDPTPAAADRGAGSPTDLETTPGTAAPARHSATSVVVEPGDTLWGIAAHHLPDDASDASIARAWRAWYQANRAIIGNDPSLVLPGQQLQAPSIMRGES